jgi:hypothetical protein
MALNPKPKPPMPGGEHTQFIDTGPQPVSPGATRVNLIPVGDGGPGPLLPRVTRPPRRKPMLPGADEIARLPAQARAALAARCTLRVLPLTGRREPAASAEDAIAAAAVAILRVSPRPGELVLIRHDFERLRRLAKANGWTDQTPVPPEVFGPLWPGRVPKWAREKPKPRE